MKINGEYMEDFEFVCAGISEDEQLIFLVDDYKYGNCSYAIKETLTDDGIDVEVDFLHETNKEVPEERQKEIVSSIVYSILETAKETEEEAVE